MNFIPIYIAEEGKSERLRDLTRFTYAGTFNCVNSINLQPPSKFKHLTQNVLHRKHSVESFPDLTLENI